MNKSPCFQFFPNDYLGKKVLRMSDASQGIYMRLLCFMWNDSKDQCSIENDDKIISKLLGITKQKWKKTRNEIQWPGDPILVDTGTFLISKRLKKEKETQLLRSNKARESAEARWHPNAKPEHSERNANASAKQCSSSSSPPSTSKKKKKHTKKEIETHFAEFYKKYPKHKGKIAALKEYALAIHKGIEPLEILKGIETQLKAKAFDFRENKKWIKEPSKWLHGGHWEDEVFIPDKKPAKEEPRTDTCFSCEKNEYVADEEDESHEEPTCQKDGHIVTLENMNKAADCDGYSRRKEEG